MQYGNICNVSHRVITDRHPTTLGRSSKWNKIAWMIELLKIYPTVVWLDMDAFLVKPRCGWLRQTAPLSIARDDYDSGKFNSGVMVVNRNAMPFLKRVWDHNDFGQGRSDQNSINHMIRSMSYPVHIMKRVYNTFPVPPHRCGGYVPPTHLKDDTNAVVRHYAGEFMGGRKGDGLIEECAFRQLKLARKASSLAGKKATDAVADHRILVFSFFGRY
jgi:hypothetical protein